MPNDAEIVKRIYYNHSHSIFWSVEVWLLIHRLDVSQSGIVGAHTLLLKLFHHQHAAATTLLLVENRSIEANHASYDSRCPRTGTSNDGQRLIQGLLWARPAVSSHKKEN